ncbi:MAG: RlmE family RNA methyltransferase [Alphaproteobacteria bacterium]|nr:RlmE family RNA methyltransferase [Alphaproteobacteria bacterium]
MSRPRGPSGGSRPLKVRVRTAKGRRLSSTLWLERQLNDPYVQQARKDGYRSRAAYKLLELDERFKILRPGARVIDLGAAPGGWTQAAVERTRADLRHGRVVAIDITAMEAVAGATILAGDVRAEGTAELLRAALGGPADVVLSDMAAPAIGDGPTDSLRTLALAEAAYEIALQLLKPGGSFIAKVLQGGTERAQLAQMKRAFAAVRHAKPPASRRESAETYVVAMGFRAPPPEAKDPTESGG